MCVCSSQNSNNEFFEFLYFYCTIFYVLFFLVCKLLFVSAFLPHCISFYTLNYYNIKKFLRSTIMIMLMMMMMIIIIISMRDKVTFNVHTLCLVQFDTVLVTGKSIMVKVTIKYVV